MDRSRRSLLKTGPLTLSAVVAASALPAQAEPRFGLLTVEGHLAHKRATGEYLHVYVDGVDVSSSCFMADDEHGWVELYCRDQAQHLDWTAQGGKHVRDGAVCRMLVRGRVVIRPGEPL